MLPVLVELSIASPAVSIASLCRWNVESSEHPACQGTLLNSLQIDSHCSLGTDAIGRQATELGAVCSPLEEKIMTKLVNTL